MYTLDQFFSTRHDFGIAKRRFINAVIEDFEIDSSYHYNLVSNKTGKDVSHFGRWDFINYYLTSLDAVKALNVAFNWEECNDHPLEYWQTLHKEIFYQKRQNQNLTPSLIKLKI